MNFNKKVLKGYYEYITRQNFFFLVYPNPVTALDYNEYVKNFDWIGMLLCHIRKTYNNIMYSDCLSFNY